MVLKLLPSSLLVIACVVGCSGGGGRSGDANDPATTTDTEQMSDETGDVGGANGRKPINRGAEGV